MPELELNPLSDLYEPSNFIKAIQERLKKKKEKSEALTPIGSREFISDLLNSLTRPQVTTGETIPTSSDYGEEETPSQTTVQPYNPLDAQSVLNEAIRQANEARALIPGSTLEGYMPSGGSRTSITSNPVDILSNYLYSEIPEVADMVDTVPVTEATSPINITRPTTGAFSSSAGTSSIFDNIISRANDTPQRRLPGINYL